MSTLAAGFGVLQKPIRKVRKVRAQSLKPPQEIVDETGGEDHKFFVVYVTDGIEHRVPCSHECWKKVKGPKPAPGRKVPGMDHKIHYDFDIVFDPTQKTTYTDVKGVTIETQLVVDVDMIPKNKYERGLVPENLEDLQEMTLRINQKTGGIEIIQIPPKVRDLRIAAIMLAIDKLETIETGQEIAGCEVTGVSGNQVVINVRGD
jgi:hypothetical protein